MAEFFNDEQRKATIAALEREVEGYEHRKVRGKHGRDPLSVPELDDRIEQVKDELARIKGEVSVEETVEDDAANSDDVETVLQSKSMVELAEIAKQVGLDEADQYAKPGVRKVDVIAAIKSKLGRKES